MLDSKLKGHCPHGLQRTIMDARPDLMRKPIPTTRRRQRRWSYCHLVFHRSDLLCELWSFHRFPYPWVTTWGRYTLLNPKSWGPDPILWFLKRTCWKKLRKPKFHRSWWPWVRHVQGSWWEEPAQGAGRCAEETASCRSQSREGWPTRCGGRG